jgi:hypothetical protein
MKYIFTLLLIGYCLITFSQTQTDPATNLDNCMPVRGFCIAAPSSEEIGDFVRFIKEELVPRKVNTLILRVDFNFIYKSHPELSDSNALSNDDVKKLVATCRDNNIKIIPQINLLGHQSWAGKTGNLLTVKMPEKYVWPNADKLYCKSYCPLHPGVHAIVFDLVDEVCDAFETDSFQAGMDEVFYIGEDQCPLCAGKDKAELFAGEVIKIHDHLANKNRKLWIWGDRLIDGRTSGTGEWEGSYNNTHKAIDLIPKDVIICDWHYERAEQTPVYFAIKGFNVVTCPWKNPTGARLQVQDMIKFRNNSNTEMKDRFLGMMETSWNGAGRFLDSFYGKRIEKGEETEVNCFKAVYEEILKISCNK